jgi:hypothetical protein
MSHDQLVKRDLALQMSDNGRRERRRQRYTYYSRSQSSGTDATPGENKFTEMQWRFSLWYSPVVLVITSISCIVMLTNNTPSFSKAVSGDHAYISSSHLNAYREGVYVRQEC